MKTIQIIYHCDLCGDKISTNDFTYKESSTMLLKYTKNIPLIKHTQNKNDKTFTTTFETESLDVCSVCCEELMGKPFHIRVNNDGSEVGWFGKESE